MDLSGPLAGHTMVSLWTLLMMAAVAGCALAAQRGEPEPPAMAKGAIVLFSGKPEEVAANFYKRGTTEDAAWPVKDGAMTTQGYDIVTKQKFTDFQLHLEWMEPDMPEAKGQAKGNSGVFMQGRYEIQVLDSYGIADPGTGDCGALYGKAAPLVNACKPALEWQTYDILFRAPRFDAEGKQVENARISVLQNGVAIQNNTVIPGPTWGETFGDLKDPGPIVLQYHGNEVKYRNVWVLPLPEKGADHY